MSKQVQTFKVNISMRDFRSVLTVVLTLSSYLLMCCCEVWLHNPFLNFLHFDEIKGLRKYYSVQIESYKVSIV